MEHTRLVVEGADAIPQESMTKYSIAVFTSRNADDGATSSRHTTGEVRKNTTAIPALSTSRVVLSEPNVPRMSSLTPPPKWATVN